MSTIASVLLAEEDPTIRTFLAENLAADGYAVTQAEDRQQAVSLLATKHPDLLVVDVNGETLDLLDAIRSGEGLAARVDPLTPILVLTRRVEALHRIRLLDRGGDDVLAKPFSYLELRARLAALLRRSRRQDHVRLTRVGELEIDHIARQVRVQGRSVHLRAKEFELLAALAAEPRRVFTKAELLRTVWGFRGPVRTRTLESHAAQLRQHLAQGGAPGLIVNSWGVGYSLGAGAVPAPK